MMQPGRDQRARWRSRNSSAPSSAPITTSPAGAEAAVDLHHDAAAQPLAHQGLVGFGEADFPGRTCVLDRG